MDFKQIKELIKLINDSNIGEVLIENDDQSIRIRHLDYQKKQVAVTAGAPVPMAMPPAQAAATPAEEAKAETESSASSGGDDSGASDAANADLITVRSPMIGTFYRSSAPDKPPYVKVGDNINQEDVLCIIEAMKLFNEIESEYSGKIVKVMVENQSPVEYDQPLFLIDPNG